MDKIRQYKNYVIIAVVSLFCLFFLPFTGSTIGMEFHLPNTIAGWTVYVTGKLIVATVNILILYCFVEQGKWNVREDPRYLQACKILLERTDHDELKPRSPRQHRGEVYGKKGATLFITSVLGSISLTQAVLTFDWITMLTYLFVLVTGVIFGILQMAAEETYWTEEFLKYAKMKEGEWLYDHSERSAAPKP